MNRMEGMPRQLPIDQPFDLDTILDGTQDFRWRRWKDDWHSGVLRGHLIHMRQVKGGLEYRARLDLDEMLVSYFRLDEDMATIRAGLAARDAKLARLVEQYPYLRVLRQPDAWECLVAYVCSLNNNVRRISAIVERVAEKVGHELELDGETRHAFPTPRQVVAAGEGALDELKLGLDRSSKIVEAAERIGAAELNLAHLSQPAVGYAEAKRCLMDCRGIGDKVADCIALFALDKREAFPVDRWIARAVARHYFPGRQPPSGHHLAMWAQDRFGEYAGYASQLLFLEERELAAATPPPVR